MYRVSTTYKEIIAAIDGCETDVYWRSAKLTLSLTWWSKSSCSYCVLVSSSGNSAAELWQLLLCDTKSTKSQPKGAQTKRVETANSKNVRRTRRKRSEACWCIKSYAWERAEWRRRLPIYVRWLLVAQILRKHEIYTHLSGFINVGIYRCWANIKRTYPNIGWKQRRTPTPYTIHTSSRILAPSNPPYRLQSWWLGICVNWHVFLRKNLLLFFKIFL